MRRSYVNAVLITIAFLAYFVLGLRMGRIQSNGGLGPDGPAYAAMVTDHDVTRGSAATRMVPAFPLLVAIGSAVTDDVVGGFVLVNLVSLALLVLAGCLTLDQASAPTSVKVCMAVTLLVLGLPSTMAAFYPAQPDLAAVALITLAVAACALRALTGSLAGRVVLALLQVGAVLASPVGIIAPLYGIWRSWRVRQRDPVSLGAFVPAWFAWALVQFWARGGVAGVTDLLRPGRVAVDAALWQESAFIVLSLYFMVTCLGGLTVMLLSRPGSIASAIREAPEILALSLPVLLFVATAGLDVPRTIPFLLPFWLLVLGSWVGTHRGAFAPSLALALVLTVLTQHPGVRMDDTRYFVDWFPYSVHAGRAGVTDPDLWGTWATRLLIVVAGFAAFAVLRCVPALSGDHAALRA